MHQSLIRGTARRTGCGTPGSLPGPGPRSGAGTAPGSLAGGSTTRSSRAVRAASSARTGGRAPRTTGAGPERCRASSSQQQKRRQGRSNFPMMHCILHVALARGQARPVMDNAAA